MSPRLARLACASAFALAASTSSARAHAEEAPVTIDANDPELEVFEQTGQYAMVPGRSRHSALERTPIFGAVCDRTPCASSLLVGERWLALGRPGGAIVSAPAPVAIFGGTHVHADYVSHSGLRAAGLVTLIGSVGGGLALMLTSIHDAPICDPATACSRSIRVDAAPFAASIGVLVAGGIIGGVMMKIDDGVSLTISPLVSPPSSKREGDGAIAMNGALLTARF